MEENKISRFIRDRRLELGLTQLQLADRLGVTDKAVSKWERAVSYPDITLLRELAAALEVSVTELLAGEREEAPTQVPPAVESVVVDTVVYAETARRKNSGWRWWLFVGLTAGCLIAAMVLLIVGAGRGSLWAALLAIRCIAFGWAVCYPLLRSERPVRNALIIASIGVYPFLLSLGLWEMRGLCIVIVSVAYAWAVYWIWLRWRGDWRKLTFLVVVLGILLHVGINVMVRWGDGERLLLALVLTLVLGALCLAAAWALERRRR